MSPKFEFILALDPRWEPDLMFADIVLPTVTNFERNDVSAWGLYEIYCSKCIPNLARGANPFLYILNTGRRTESTT